MKIKRIIALSVALVLAAFAGITAMLMSLKISSLHHENIAKSFSPEKEYAQITLFLPESAGFTVDRVMYFRYNLEKYLTDNSMEPENGGRLYVDAYSAFRNISLDSDSGRQTQAKALYVGGDYSLFHDELAFMPDIAKDINHDRILISKSAAWNLYGGYELYDFKASDGDKELYISGVYEDYNDEEFISFYGDRAPCVIDIAGYPEMNITCYEIIMVNPVNNFARDAVVQSLGMDEEAYLLVENSRRFSLPNIFGAIPELIRPDEQLLNGIVLTPEEMLARQTEKELAVMLVLFMVLAIYPLIYLVIYIVRFIILVKKFINKHITGKIKDKFSYS